jgi:hypothetical protein
MTGIIISPTSHQAPEIRKVLEDLAAQGWTLRKGGHWGILYCPCKPLCMRIGVPGTKANPGNTARKIAREAARCPRPEDHPLRPPARVVS